MMYNKGKLFKLLFVFLIIFFVPAGGKAGVEVTEKNKGVWLKPGEKEEEDFNWKAQWIWMDSGKENDVMLARYSFDLEELSGRALLRITSSQLYILYINGNYVARGPARSAPHNQSYDILNVQDFLSEGINNISV
ncbi:MAG: hypothetical protein KAS71_09020, partial [Bacteroidales bacterium]|nr:hypothetical protein [Bacteroidales bacterium]